jgi:hypothetical protein
MFLVNKYYPTKVSSAASDHPYRIVSSIGKDSTPVYLHSPITNLKNLHTMSTLTLAEINNLDIVDFLASIGYRPQKVTGHNYWYLSMLPGRFEKTPSFKVNRKINRWKDFGNGEGSTLVDFGIKYYNCTIRELVLKLSGPAAIAVDVPRFAPPKENLPAPELEILSIQPIRSFNLERYIWERRVALNVAQKYCVEAHYRIGNKDYYAIGFQCNAGGYELRNKYFKGGSAPKGPTFFDNGSDELLVFEGFFDLLTFLTFSNCGDDKLPNFLCLNSLVYFEFCFELMERHKKVRLFLDNDMRGNEVTAMALRRLPVYIDHRPLYKRYKDLNEWACCVGKAVIPSLDTCPVAIGSAA